MRATLLLLLLLSAASPCAAFVNVVSNLQGRAISSATPSVDDVLKWSGSAWAPGTAGGLSGLTAGQVLVATDGTHAPGYAALTFDGSLLSLDGTESLVKSATGSNEALRWRTGGQTLVRIGMNSDTGYPGLALNQDSRLFLSTGEINGSTTTSLMLGAAEMDMPDNFIFNMWSGRSSIVFADVDGDGVEAGRVSFKDRSSNTWLQLGSYNTTAGSPAISNPSSVNGGAVAIHDTQGLVIGDDVAGATKTITITTPAYNANAEFSLSNASVIHARGDAADRTELALGSMATSGYDFEIIQWGGGYSDSAWYAKHNSTLFFQRVGGDMDFYLLGASKYFQFGLDSGQKFKWVARADGTEVGSVDNSGNASFGGTLTAGGNAVYTAATASTGTGSLVKQTSPDIQGRMTWTQSLLSGQHGVASTYTVVSGAGDEVAMDFEAGVGTGSGGAGDKRGAQFIMNNLSSPAPTGTVIALDVRNDVPGTGSNLRLGTSNIPTGNIGMNASVGRLSASPGLSIGVSGAGTSDGSSGTTTIGVLGRGFGSGAAGSAIGVAGFSKGLGSIALGGYFGLNTATPTFASAALIADNGAISAPVFLGRVNGTTTFTIDASGNVSSTKPVAVANDSGLTIQNTGATQSVNVSTTAANTLNIGGALTVNGVAITPGGFSYNNTADATAITANSETACSLTPSTGMPSGALNTAGAHGHIHGSGIISTAVSSGTNAIGFRIGSTTLFTDGGASLTASMSNKPFEFDIEWSTRSTGASGTVVGSVRTIYEGIAAASTLANGGTNGASTTVDLTGTPTISITNNFSNTGNSITVQDVHMDLK